MSLSYLADDEMRRTEPTYLGAPAKLLVHETAARLAPRFNLTAPEISNLVKDDLTPLAAADASKPGPSENAFNALVKYIPTETITLYVAVMSAMAALKDVCSWISPSGVYWLFVFLTPAILFLIIIGKRRARNLQPLLPALKSWPWWNMAAATVAFAVWALAVPTNPYLTGLSGGAVAGFLAILVSTLLSLLQPIFE